MHTCRSRTFESTGKIEIGRQLPLASLSPVLKIVSTFARFHFEGKMVFCMVKLHYLAIVLETAFLATL